MRSDREVSFSCRTLFSVTCGQEVHLTFSARGRPPQRPLLTKNQRAPAGFGVEQITARCPSCPSPSSPETFQVLASLALEASTETMLLCETRRLSARAAGLWLRTNHQSTVSKALRGCEILQNKPTSLTWFPYLPCYGDSVGSISRGLNKAQYVKPLYLNNMRYPSVRKNLGEGRG